MRTKVILELVLSGLCLIMSHQLYAASSVISVTATADNDFIVLHRQGNSFTEVLRSNDGNQWRKPQSAKYKLENSRLKECSIDIIAWDDHSVKQGMAASITGNDGNVLSGSPAMKSYSTKIGNSPTWANTGYPNIQMINQILGSLIPSPTHSHGTVNNTHPWGNISGNGLPANAQWIWAKDSLYNYPYAKMFTVYRTPCDQIIKVELPANKGMTWTKKAVDPVVGVLTVGCKTNSYECNPYQGDQLCTVAMPILCKKELNLPKPNSVQIPNKYSRWSGNVVGTTRAISPSNANITTLSQANAFCVSEFGIDWKVAEFHDGWAWNFISYGNVGTQSKRFWVNIKDQNNGNCWNQN